MYIDQSPMLHFIDFATKFSSALFLPDASTKAVYSTFVECCASIYTRMPSRIRVDRGSCFGGDFFSIAKKSNIDVARSGVDAHSALGVGERYHEPLRNTLRNAKLNMPHMSEASILTLCLKAMNDILGSEGSVPSALVFGEFPSTRHFE